MNHNSLIRHKQALDLVITEDVLTGLDVPNSPLSGVNIRQSNKTGRPIGVSICVCDVVAANHDDKQ